MNDEFSKEDLINHRLNRARENFIEAKGAAAIGYPNSSINRLYYSCYYAVTALLFKDDLNAKTHAGVRNMFALHYVETGKITRYSGKFYSALFQSRQQSDYEDFFIMEIETLNSLIENAEQFIETIETMIKTSSKK